MYKHIVMFRLLDFAEGKTKAENARIIKERLEGLNGVVPGMIKLEVGLNIKEHETASDVVVYGEFETLEALKAYTPHPKHHEIAEYVAKVRSERRIVDYLVDE